MNEVTTLKNYYTYTQNSINKNYTETRINTTIKRFTEENNG